MPVGSGASLFLGGFGAGVALAAPFGPVGALCVSVTLRRGRWWGVVAGLGAALGDTLFAAVVLFGLAGLVTAVSTGQAALRIVAGSVLLTIVVARIVAARKPRAPRVDGGEPERRGVGRYFVAGLGLTLSNPAALVPFAAVLGAIGVLESAEPWGCSVVTLGVFLGALTWWLLLTTAAHHFRRRLGQMGVAVIERAVTGLLAVFAVGLIVAGLANP